MRNTIETNHFAAIALMRCSDRADILALAYELDADHSASDLELLEAKWEAFNA